ncbi:hypothetical protein FD724_14550 [Nostoc sp. C057]|uniref:hypothetical protein n=1 Tax=Nostoc sp. C057 TaxID=2576903 RepID=UPI0015C3F87D|nr:hypothetical protein [Nostoc sp. C057]QLE49193.1 hypothetical protein FD724_14550 [Nostoc sp. C057]
MTTSKNHSHYFQDINHLHSTLAPIMLLPLLLTTITGTVYQIVDLAGKKDQFHWLLHWHKGDFGALNLEVIYPFLNALGLFILLFTGISMWLQLRHTSHKQFTEAQSND